MEVDSERSIETEGPVAVWKSNDLSGFNSQNCSSNLSLNRTSKRQGVTLLHMVERQGFTSSGWGQGKSKEMDYSSQS